MEGPGSEGWSVASLGALDGLIAYTSGIGQSLDLTLCFVFPVESLKQVVSKPCGALESSLDPLPIY